MRNIKDISEWSMDNNSEIKSELLAEGRKDTDKGVILVTHTPLGSKITLEVKTWALQRTRAPPAQLQQLHRICKKLQSKNLLRIKTSFYEALECSFPLFLPCIKNKNKWVKCSGMILEILETWWGFQGKRGDWADWFWVLQSRKN